MIKNPVLAKFCLFSNNFNWTQQKNCINKPSAVQLRIKWQIQSTNVKWCQTEVSQRICQLVGNYGNQFGANEPRYLLITSNWFFLLTHTSHGDFTSYTAQIYFSHHMLLSVKVQYISAESGDPILFCPIGTFWHSYSWQAYRVAYILHVQSQILSHSNSLIYDRLTGNVNDNSVEQMAHTTIL